MEHFGQQRPSIRKQDSIVGPVYQLASCGWCPPGLFKSLLVSGVFAKAGSLSRISAGSLSASCSVATFPQFARRGSAE